VLVRYRDYDFLFATATGLSTLPFTLIDGDTVAETDRSFELVVAGQAWTIVKSQLAAYRYAERVVSEQPKPLDLNVH